MSEKQKIVYVLTTGPENPEKLTLPFMLATAGQTIDVEVLIVLQGPAVFIAKKGFAAHIKALGLPALADLLEIFLQNGGKIAACVPCLKERGIAFEDLVEGAGPIAAVELTQHFLSADATLVY